ncbi:MAG TPA: hypothetical protein VFI11_12380 [Anaerolineales bacterium]|nr:hypothetical protein [Anaerolineales bacterium]
MAKAAAQRLPDPGKDPAGYTVFRLRVGASRDTIMSELEAAGVDRIQASKVVHDVIEQIRKLQEQEKITSAAIVRGLVAAGVAAIIGGILWGIIVILTKYEIGYMATGVGLLTGYATARVAQARGRPLQIIAVVAALAGIFIGKYLSFFAAVKEVVLQDYGSVAASQVMVVDPELFVVFLQSLGELVSPYDLLWVILAVLAAWRIPAAMGFRLPQTV